MTMNLEDIAASTLEAMKAAGFDAAQVDVSVSGQDELNIAFNKPSLLRSTEDYSLSLTGILDGRKAGAALTDLGEHAIEHGVKELYERAQMAPQDDANAVSSGQSGHFEQGPQEGDLDILAQKVEELLEWRAAESPMMNIDEGEATYMMAREHVLTSEGSSISCAIGCYGLSVMGTAVDGDQSSSFNYTGGNTNDLQTAHASQFFGIGDMLKDTQNQIHTEPVGENFVGDIVLAPTAVTDLLGWLFGQLGDYALISDGSIYKDAVGDLIASPLLNIRSRFDGPGHAAYTGDAFLAPALDLVSQGRLGALLPGFYGSRKTGIKHTPTGSGWSIDAGDMTKADLIGSIKHGALVNRLSMGSPGANGDFSGVIKNSFAIRDGALGPAVSESMIAGNMATMLKDINGISKERLDTGSTNLPWIRIPNLNFS